MHAATKIELREIGTIKPYEKNAKRHPKEQIEKLAAIIKRHGFDQPIVVDSAGVIIKGHGRLLASKQLGLKKVPVLVRSDLSPAQVREARIADNRVSELGSWDDELLAEDMREALALFADDFDADLLGLKASFVEAHVRMHGEIEEDEIPEPPKNPITKKGDLWLLGEHRLLCGDSTDVKNIAYLFDGVQKAALCQTDPPYGVNFLKNKRGMRGSGFETTAHSDIVSDDLDGPALQSFLEAVIKNAVPYLENHAAWYLWHPMLTQGTFFAAAAAADILIHRQIIWVKPQMILTRSGQYHWRHELCFYGWRRGFPANWYGSKAQTSVWELGRDSGVAEHPTQKPVALFKPAFENHTRVGDVAFEPFAGSGSQLICAEQLERRVVALELEPKYCDVIVQRWETLTGQKADRVKAQH